MSLGCFTMGQNHVNNSLLVAVRLRIHWDFVVGKSVYERRGEICGASYYIITRDISRDVTLVIRSYLDSCVTACFNIAPTSLRVALSTTLPHTLPCPIFFTNCVYLLCVIPAPLPTPA